MGTVNEKIRILQVQKLEKCKLTWTKNEQNILQSPKLGKH